MNLLVSNKGVSDKAIVEAQIASEKTLLEYAASQGKTTLGDFIKVYYVKNPDTNAAFAVDEHQLHHYAKLGYPVISKEEALELMANR